MEAPEFVHTYLPSALLIERETRVPALATLTQAAIESGWGKYAPGFAFFGIKDTDGVNGNEQLETTTEYSKRADLKFPVILSVVPTLIHGEKFFKYRVKDYFRSYKSAADSFRDHAAFLQKNSRYAPAFYHSDAAEFLSAVAAAGYATDPNYKQTCLAVLATVKKYIP